MTNQGEERVAKGNFSATPLPQVVAFIFRKALSGTLIIKDGKGKNYRVFFSNGLPSYVDGEGLGHPVGKIFVETGLIKSESLERYLKEANEHKQILGSYLLKEGIIGRRQLETAVRIQIKRRMKEVFSITEGEFEFHEQKNLTEFQFEDMVQTNLPALLPEALRDKWSDELLAKVVEPLRGFKFKVSDFDYCRRSFGWDSSELASLDFLDAKTWTLEKIELVAGEKLKSYRIVLYCLLLTGLLKFEEAETAQQKEAREAERKRKIDKFYKLMNEKMEEVKRGNYFEILGVKEDASLEEIKESYFLLLKKFHPDRVQPFGDETLRKGYIEISQKIKEALDVLTDPEQKEKYLKKLKGEEEVEEEEEDEIVKKTLQAEYAYQKALILVNRKKWKEAADMMEPYIGEDVENGEYLSVYGWAKMMSLEGGQDYTKYLKFLQRAVELAPTSEKANYFLALAYHKDGKMSKYEEHLRAAAEINPHNIEVQRRLHILEMTKARKKKKTSALGEKLKSFFKLSKEGKKK